MKKNNEIREGQKFKAKAPFLFQREKKNEPACKVYIIREMNIGLHLLQHT